MALASDRKIEANLDFQITCIYDMDIVFEPNGVFNEVYLYVSSTTQNRRSGDDRSRPALRKSLWKQIYMLS